MVISLNFNTSLNELKTIGGYPEKILKEMIVRALDQYGYGVINETLSHYHTLRTKQSETFYNDLSDELWSRYLVKMVPPKRGILKHVNHGLFHFIITE